MALLRAYVYPGSSPQPQRVHSTDSVNVGLGIDSDTTLGLGTAQATAITLGRIDPTCTLLVQAPTTLKNHSAFTGSGRIEETFAAQTTDATLTTAFTYALPDNTAQWVKVHIIARNNANNGDHAYWELICMVSRDAAAAPVLGHVQTLNGDNATSASTPWIATINVSSNNLIVQVQGLAATTIEWGGFILLGPISGAT